MKSPGAELGQTRPAADASPSDHPDQSSARGTRPGRGPRPLVRWRADLRIGRHLDRAERAAAGRRRGQDSRPARCPGKGSNPAALPCHHQHPDHRHRQDHRDGQRQSRCRARHRPSNAQRGHEVGSKLRRGASASRIEGSPEFRFLSVQRPASVTRPGRSAATARCTRTRAAPGEQPSTRLTSSMGRSRW